MYFKKIKAGVYFLQKRNNKYRIEKIYEGKLKGKWEVLIFVPIYNSPSLYTTTFKCFKTLKKAKEYLINNEININNLNRRLSTNFNIY